MISSFKFLACPDFKGIKTVSVHVCQLHDFCFWPALISKGLRPNGHLFRGLVVEFLACPDFKGIKTQVFAGPLGALLRFWPALISKGLRRSTGHNTATRLRFWPALISKGLRLIGFCVVRIRSMFLACPDFKGIKTWK